MALEQMTGVITIDGLVVRPERDGAFTIKSLQRSRVVSRWIRQ
jgi:hypothetical protein